MSKTKTKSKYKVMAEALVHERVKKVPPLNIAIPAVDESAAEDAHKKGLSSAAFGRWKDKSGKVVAMTKGDKLVPVQSKGKPGASSAPKSNLSPADFGKQPAAPTKKSPAPIPTKPVAPAKKAAPTKSPAKSAPSVPAAAPSSAMKVRNMIVKTFGGKSYSSGESNPYSNTQKMVAAIPASKGKALVDNLTRNGWKPTKDHMWTDSNIQVFQHSGHTIDLFPPENGKIRINITGPKKAKPTTIPYYD